jgi:zeaxanthin glucosyltransferase
MFRAMTKACADLGARAVVAHGGLLSEAAAQALPGDPIVAPYWPQPAILPQCRAALLHGGFNTVLDALAAGVPMGVRPLAFEQPGTAARVARSGAGITLGSHLLANRRMRAALRSLLEEPAFAQAAGAMAQGMAKLGGAALAANLVEDALRTGRTPRARA